MDISFGEEFKIKATPSPELMRRLAYLAVQDNGSVFTGLKSNHNSERGAEAEQKKRAEALMLARLADPAYQAMSQQINAELDLMDEASVDALQEIEEELTELRRKREKLLEQAYRDEQGRAIFMTQDGSAAYYEYGAAVADDEFAQIKDRLQGKPTMEELQEFDRRQEELFAERGQIHQHDAKRQQLREDLAKGAISKEEAQRREKEIEEAMPERMRHSYKPPESSAKKDATPQNTELSADELADLDARATPAQGPAAGPAACPRNSGPSSL